MFKEFGYSLIIDENNLVVRDHIVHGAKVMPGIVLLDLCIKVLLSENIDYKTIEFRNILFKTPIELLTSNKRELVISLKNIGQKSFITGKSHIADIEQNNTDEMVEHFECEICQVSPTAREQINISEQLTKSAEYIQDMDEAYKFVRNVGITHKSFMKAEGKVYCFKDKIITHSKLSQEANQYKDGFFHQPSIMDSSTIIPYLCIRDNKISEVENKAFIPIHIEKFRAFKPLYSEAYVYIENKDVSVANSGDVTSASWKIFDEQGQLAADIERLSSKQIREVGMATKQVTSTQEINSDEQEAPKLGLEKLSLTENSIEKYIIKKIEDLKKIIIQESDLEKGFYELGLDSRDLISVVKNIENQINIQLYPTIMFEYSNIKELSEYLKGQFSEQFNIYLTQNQTPPPNQKREKVKVTADKLNNQNDENVIFEAYWKEDIEEKEQSGEYGPSLTIILTNDSEVYKKAKEQLRNVIHICSNKMCKEIDDNNSYCINPLNKEEIEQVFSKTVPENANVNVVNMFDFDCLNELVSNYSEQVVYIFNALFCQALIKFADANSKIRIVNIGFHDNANNCYTSALTGFYKCLAAEKTRITSSIITLEYDKKLYSSQLVWKLIINEFSKQKLPVNEIKYRDYVRHVKELCLTEYKESTNVLFKDNGTYIITGGMGAIGKSLVNAIYKQYACNIILLGRSSITNEMDIWLQRVNSGKAKVVYHSADICNKQAVDKEVRWTLAEHGKINGIIHAAGCLQDAIIMSKKFSAEAEEPAITTKVAGINNLDSAIGEEKIDYMILFSSISAVFGNLGQSNYAYGNGYMDNFSSMRNELAHKKLRYGRTLSINWPLWELDGMDVGYDYSHIYNATGIQKMNHNRGIDLLLCANYDNSSQLIILNGVKAKINSFMTKHYKITDKNHVQQRKSMSEAYSQSKNIAIIGIGGQFPMAGNVMELWENLKSGKDCIQTVPEERWTREDIKAIIGEDSTLDVSNYGGFLKEIDRFDSRLFHITPSEAKMMDPQERLFLSIVWTTLEDAGYSMKQLVNKDIGVYVGTMWGQYQMFSTLLDNQPALPSSIFASIANRVSYYFNWHGPSLSIDTMCSSAMTAVKMACDSINNNEAEMAIAGGVNLSIHPAKYIVLAQNNFTSKDGRCRSFGENGSGYVPGEGVGALLLKKLDKAVENGDHIYGVIKACEINHGGRTGGYSVPSVQYQSKVIERAIKASKVLPSDISYIEAHGTGTALGDPIEIRALQSVFDKYTNEKQFCSIGSIKSNIGHLEAAAGIAGIIKVLLQMKYKKIVPSLHSKKINPNIDFKGTAFYCQQEYENWNSDGLRAAAISAFGAGGSNANIIIQEYEPSRSKVRGVSPKLFVFSAYNQDILLNYVKKHIDFLSQYSSYNDIPTENIDLADLDNIIIDFFGFNNNELLCTYLLDELNFDLYKMVKLEELLKRNRLKSPSVEQFAVCKSISELRQLLKTKNDCNETVCEVKAKSELSQEEEAEFLDSYEYTLQTGRVHMKKRLAVIASTTEELLVYLKMFLQNQNHENIILKQSKGEESTLLSMFKGNAGVNFIKALIDSGDLNNIGQLWVEGIDLEWEKLSNTKGRRRMSLPTYPFSGEQIPSAQLAISHNKGIYEEKENSDELNLYEIIKKVESGTMTVNSAIGFLERGN
ncbi:6-deoxyerythronolide-B synthase [Ruminiclostridium papyrosolvens DSM 2782]|uniref:6-deoxyerythronolide-B synthase n=1 Tax=Ruminiclostridium papyrosolvens DSM 2782 TaxID=588581 RepID=F1T735_9FIRM|nr:SDR family NAD(P)-dependent oxidoreductase [Ruminiclostridium papyrosolvens]EGD49283.1 6-deoxyerythronolide-B synthase [Ruminiclostridium papyrosolvens DSM 2782]WES33588.1 SDR family NAD(P)-dependent oxidoreductase [Ruminiclostridium papyrosolvens DSM 2782]